MLPKNLKYQNKVESASANAYSTNVSPQNGQTYSDGQTIIINIPTRQNLCLIGSESTLKFSLTVKPSSDANFVRLDRGGANGVIQRLRLYSGSNLLEDIDNYSLLMANLISLQKSNGSVRGKYNISNGTRIEDMVVGNCKLNGAGFVNNNTDSTIVGRSYIAPGGERLFTGTAENEVVATAGLGSAPRAYSISLLSILGTLGSQYVPLFAMAGSGPLRLELQLVDNANKFCCSDKTLTSFQLTNVEYIASFLELSDSSMQTINNSLGGQPLQYVIPSFRNYVHTNNIVAGVTTQINAPCPAKFSSLKSLFSTIRKVGNIGAATFFPHSSCTYGLSSYNLRVGSKIIPAKAPSTVSEFFVEACKAIGSVSDINHCPTMSMYSYNVKADTANIETHLLYSNTSMSKNFIIGADLEVYANADKDSIFSGYNSLNDDIFIQMMFDGTAAGADVAARFDFFALYDSLLICENQTAYVKF